jgi:hypothetical protein
MLDGHAKGRENERLRFRLAARTASDATGTPYPFTSAARRCVVRLKCVYEGHTFRVPGRHSHSMLQQSFGI